MYKVGICGHFALGKELLNGQTIKTKIITKELENQLGEHNVQIVDSHDVGCRMPKLVFNCLRMFIKCRNIIIMPAINGLKVFVPLFSIINKLYNRKLHYVVIGGWLVGFIDKNKWLAKLLKKFDGIYVETYTMKSDLENRGFTNIYVMPNCKDLKILSVDELIYSNNEPYKLCTFSRVMKEKGIEDAIYVVKSINEKLGRVAYVLDIYGQVDKEYEECFKKLCNGFPPYIKYGGLIQFDKSVEVLKNYFLLLFPTHFTTEGIPGTIIDAYFAGLPIICAKWNNYHEIIDDGKTGIGYEIKNNTELISILEKFLFDNSPIFGMKNNCIKKASEYLARKVVKDFTEFLS